MYISNPEWDILDFPAIRHVLLYNCCPEPYPDVTYYITMKVPFALFVLRLYVPVNNVTVMPVSWSVFTQSVFFSRGKYGLTRSEYSVSAPSQYFFWLVGCS